MQQFLQRIYDNGFIELAPYSGLYCVSCEDYYTEDQLVDGNCPVHGRPVVEMQEDNYFFKLSAFEQRLLEYYDSHPDFVRPDLQAQRGARVHPRRPARRLDHPHLVHVGRAGALGRRARLLRLVRRAHQLPHGGRLRRRPGDVRGPVGRRPPPDRQGHPQVPLRVVAGHVHGGRASTPPAEIFVHGYLLMGGQKLGKTMIAAGVAGEATGAEPLKITDVSPLALADDFGVDPLRYHLLREVPLGGDGDFSYEGIVARYNADLANNLGNLVSRVTTVVALEVRRRRAGLRPGEPAGRRGGRGARGGRRRPGRAGRRTRRSRRPGGSSARPTRELEAAEPWKMEPGPAVDAVLGDALEVLRIVAVLIVPAMPSTAAEVWRRIGVAGDPVGGAAARPTRSGAATPAEPRW